MHSHKCHCSILHRDRPSLSGKCVQEGGRVREESEGKGGERGERRERRTGKEEGVRENM